LSPADPLYLHLSHENARDPELAAPLIAPRRTAMSREEKGDLSGRLPHAPHIADAPDVILGENCPGGAAMSAVY